MIYMNSFLPACVSICFNPIFSWWVRLCSVPIVWPVIFNITVIQVYDPTSNAWRSRCWTVLWWLTRFSKTNTKKDVLFIIVDWNAKVGSQEISGVTGKFGFGVQNEAGQRLTEFCQGTTLVIANTRFQKSRDNSIHEHHQGSIVKSDCL